MDCTGAGVGWDGMGWDTCSGGGRKGEKGEREKKGKGGGRSSWVGGWVRVFGGEKGVSMGSWRGKGAREIKGAAKNDAEK